MLGIVYSIRVMGNAFTVRQNKFNITHVKVRGEWLSLDAFAAALVAGDYDCTRPTQVRTAEGHCSAVFVSWVFDRWASEFALNTASRIPMLFIEAPDAPQHCAWLQR